MSISKMIKQVLSIVKDIRNVLIGNKNYKSYPVTRIKVTEPMRQLFSAMMGYDVDLDEYNVIGKFNDDKTSFNGFYETFAIPAETIPVFPNGAILNFPFPVLNTGGDKVIEEKVSEYVIASWLSAKDSPFMLQGCCEISYGEIDITLAKQIAGDFEIKKMPDFVCEFDVFDEIKREDNGFIRAFEEGIKPQVSFNGDSQNNIGLSICLSSYEDNHFEIPKVKFCEANETLPIPHYELDVDGDKYQVSVLNVRASNAEQLYAIALTDTQFSKEWLLKHSIAIFAIKNGFISSLNNYCGDSINGTRGVLPLVVKGVSDVQPA